MNEEYHERVQHVSPSVGWSVCLLVRVGYAFLGASTHLYKRVCPSISPSVGLPVRGPSRVF